MISRPANKTKEDYLHVIYDIASSNNGEQLVRNSSIADVLNIKPSSITEMIQKLANEGYINWIKHKGIKLTKAGRELARRIHESNQLLSVFLEEHLKLKDVVLIRKLASILEHEVLHEPELKNAIQGIIHTNKIGVK
ncbi:MAG: metal-dependent transcriptional regulator [Candidatus Hodarchaeota archaeon]